MPPLNDPSSSRPTSPLRPAAPVAKAGRRRSAAAAAPARHRRDDPSCAAVLWKERQKPRVRLRDALAGPARAIAPISIIGGTFSVYSSAMKLSANHASVNAVALTPVSILYLMLLALNYAVMPRLSKRYIHPSTNKQSLALVEEAVKMSLGLGGWILTSYVTASNTNRMIAGDLDALSTDPVSTVSVLSEQLENWSPVSTLLAAGLPSALYALQGTLTYTAYQNLDSVTFNGLSQLKVLSTALCCYLVLGKKQSGLQLLSLGLLMVSAAVFQGSWKEWLARGRQKRDDAAAEGKAGHGPRSLWRGVLPCLCATLLSGLAGACSQRSLQTQVGRMRRNAYFYTVEISFLSAACLALSMGAAAWRGRAAAAGAPRAPADGRTGSSGNGFFQHWTYATLLPVATKATAGLLTALVHRHLGSVVKGFALVLGLVCSALLQFALEGVDLTGGQLAGTALVLLSSWVHFTNPVKS